MAASGFEDQAYSGAKGTAPEYPIDPVAYDGRCPADSGRSPAPPLCEVQALQPATSQSRAYRSQDDLAQMRAYGFDLVRLTINWSELEPGPGTYSTTFLNRIAQVVGWARRQGIYVILDMHQDQYSRFLTEAAQGVPDPPGCSSSNGQDGAPEWATATGTDPACALLGQNELNPAMATAFFHFFNDDDTGAAGRPVPQGASPGPGLADHYIGALAALARRFVNDPTVLGYELMNEPLPGAAPGSALPISNLYEFSDNILYPFYRRVIEALTGVTDGKPACPNTNPWGPCAYPALAHISQQQIFVEPTGYVDSAEFAPQVSAPFTTYPNLVYSPHIYTHVFTIDTMPGARGSYPPSYTFGYANAIADAEAMHAALLVTEYGDSSSSDTSILAGMTAAQEQSLSGSVFWTWKENCGNANPAHCANGWGVWSPPAGMNGHPVAQNGPRYPVRAEYLQRAWPVATAGRLDGVSGVLYDPHPNGYSYDPADHSFVMAAESSGPVRVGDRTRETVIMLPPGASGRVYVTGSAKLDTIVASSGGWRIAYLAPTTAGPYRVEEIGSPFRSAPAIAMFGTNLPGPLQPVSELQARATLETWLSQQSSPLVAAAAGILLGPPASDPNLP